MRADVRSRRARAGRRRRAAVAALAGDVGADRRAAPAGASASSRCSRRTFDVDGDAVARASAALDGVDAADDAARLGAQAALRAALAPTYEALFDRLAQEDDGLRFLVGLRADLLGALDGGRGGVPPPRRRRARS